MAKNDVVLLDSLVQKAKSQITAASDDSELFELFCFNQILKQYEPTFDDLESGWTDGGNDGGLDGFFVFVDDRIATENVEEYALRKNPNIELYLISVRRSPKFEQQPIDTLTSTLVELLDLTISDGDLKYPYNEDVITQRNQFRSVFVKLADRQPNIKINIVYASRSESSEPAPNILARSEALESAVHGLFSNADIQVTFAGAPYLLMLSRRGLDFQIRLPLAEAPISREGNRFIILCALPDFYAAVCDERGHLKRYLFESNVRGYTGNGAVNTDIAGTLANTEAPNQSDFWWLNNGVTILATDAWIMAKEILIENAQIVNGLQTTETLYRHFSKGVSLDDKRAILVKIIVAVEDDVRARIIKATNYQSTIDLAQLRGLDKIQRDIDDFLLDNGWFYDRQKNVYKNQGKPEDRIISIPYLAAAVRAIALGEPAKTQRQRSRTLRQDEVYETVFNKTWDLRVYLACIEITRAVESALHSKRNSWWNSLPIALSHFIGFIYVCQRIGKIPYEPEEIIPVLDCLPTKSDVFKIRDELQDASKSSHINERRFKGILLNTSFVESYVKHKLASPDNLSDFVFQKGKSKPQTEIATSRSVAPAPVPTQKASSILSRISNALYRRKSE
jgi:AIPR protein